jgi:hypothetical protein
MLSLAAFTIVVAALTAAREAGPRPAGSSTVGP